MDLSAVSFQRFDYVVYVQYQLVAGAMIMAALGLWNLHAEVRGLMRITLIALSIFIIYQLERTGLVKFTALNEALRWLASLF